MKLSKYDYLDSGRLATLRHCLVIAAERFDDHAKELTPSADQYEAADAEGKAAMEAATPMVHPRIYRQLSDQFIMQAKEAREFIDWLDGDQFQDENGDFPQGTDFVIVAGLTRE